MDDANTRNAAQIWHAIEVELIDPLPLPAIPYVAAYLMTDPRILPPAKLGMTARLADRAGVHEVALEPVHEAAARLHCLRMGHNPQGDDADALRATVAACGGTQHAKRAAQFMAALPGVIRRTVARRALTLDSVDEPAPDVDKTSAPRP